MSTGIDWYHAFCEAESIVEEDQDVKEFYG